MTKIKKILKEYPEEYPGTDKNKEIKIEEVNENRHFSIREIANDNELPDSNTDKMLAKLQIEWLDNLPQKRKDLIAEKTNLEFIKKAIFSYDYRELVLHVLLLNQLAKDFYLIRPCSWKSEIIDLYGEELEEYNEQRVGISDKFYEIKEIALAKACQLAQFQAPDHSYGIDEDRGIDILYFDLPGYGQFSFHMPYIKKNYRKNINLVTLYENINIPKYHGDWKQRNEIWISSMTREEAENIIREGERKISLEEIEQYLSERDQISPKEAHDLYFKAMAHPDFNKNQQRISELLFKDAPTIPGALPQAYLNGFDLPYKYFSKRIKKREPWMDYLSPTHFDIIFYIEELDALLDYAIKDQTIEETKESTFYDPEELEQQKVDVETDIESIKENLNKILKPALLFYLDDSDKYDAHLRRDIYNRLGSLLKRLDLDLHMFLPPEHLDDVNRLNRE